MFLKKESRKQFLLNKLVFMKNRKLFLKKIIK